MSNTVSANIPLVNTGVANTGLANTILANSAAANVAAANKVAANAVAANAAAANAVAANASSKNKLNNSSINNNLNNLNLNNINLNNLLENNSTKNKSKNTPPPTKNNIGNTMSNIKNQILGNGENSNTTKNKSNKNNSENNNTSNKKNKNNYKNKNSSDEDESSMGETIGKIVIMIVVLTILYYVSKYLLIKYTSSGSDSPYLLTGSKNAKYALVISQDPASINYTAIKQSEEKDGIQFTYGFWILLQGFDYKKGEWKHIFHKGNASSYPNRAPGVWLHPNKNDIRVYMNTLDNIMEYVDVENLPNRKWIYMNIVLNNKNLDLYVNGYLKIRKELSSLPKQNSDDFWVNMFGGFEGYVSNIRYYSYAIDFNEMNTNIKKGPSIDNCIDTGEVPPYLDDNWWFDYNI